MTLFSISVLLFLLPLRPRADEDSACRAEFQAGEPNFVLDVEGAVRGGAMLLATAHASTPSTCEGACCANPRCNLALLEPALARAEGDSRSCLLFNCVRKNLFVCRFVNEAGYQSYIRTSVFRKYLEGPAGEEAPPIANPGRDVIIRPDVAVMLNGIESLAMGGALISDYTWSLHSGNSSVHLQKTNLSDQIQVSNLQPGSYQFRLTVSDSNQRTGTSLVSVLVLGPDLTNRYCLAPAKPGPCRAAFDRWRYNAVNGMCEQFVFGGCKPNKNNYLSEVECLAACSGVTATPAERFLSQGVEVCGPVCRPDQFTCGSGCCLDSSLECDGVQQCSDGLDEEQCNQLNRTFSRLLKVNIDEKQAHCTEPPRTGPCRASFPRWYYDPLGTACQRFTYGGCDPNNNNFEDEMRCQETCSGITEEHVFARGMFERHEEAQDSNSGSVALAVVLAVSILALLAVLTYCFLKSRRERSAPQNTAGPAHLGPFEQDSLVYNQTTKPL